MRLNIADGMKELAKGYEGVSEGFREDYVLSVNPANSMVQFELCVSGFIA